MGALIFFIREKASFSLKNFVGFAVGKFKAEVSVFGVAAF